MQWELRISHELPNLQKPLLTSQVMQKIMNQSLRMIRLIYKRRPVFEELTAPVLIILQTGTLSLLDLTQGRSLLEKTGQIWSLKCSLLQKSCFVQRGELETAKSRQCQWESMERKNLANF